MAISLRTRLLVVIGVVALSAVAVVAVAARLGTRVEFDKFQTLERTHDDDRVKTSSADVAAILDHRCCEHSVVDAALATLAPGEALIVFDASGHAIVTAGRNVDAGNATVTFTNDTLSIAAKERRQGIAQGVSLILRGVPHASIALANGDPATVHVVVWPRDDVRSPAKEFLGSVDRRLIGVTIAVGVMALLATWVIAKGIGGPIAELNRATKDLARGDFARRVPAEGADELGDLARSFNHMASELERQQTLRRNLVHDVAHELRTPLTSLRCRLETVIDGLAADPRPAVVHANEEVAHLSQLVADLEELAHAEAGELALTMGRVNLGDVAVSSARVAGLENDPRLQWRLDDGAVARGDATRIRQIVVNLLTNADRHTLPGGTITLATARDGGDTVISIHNTGSWLNEEEALRVFDRFYRVDPSRQRATGGSGLGLAIVKHLTEVQNGSACALSDGTGVTFVIRLPSFDPNA